MSLTQFTKRAYRTLLSDPSLGEPRPSTEETRAIARGAAYLAECALAYARSFEESPSAANDALARLLAAARVFNSTEMSGNENEERE